MKKSILEQFASDAINAPAAVTGGGGEAHKSSAHKSPPKKNTAKKSTKQKSRHASSKGRGSLAPHV